MVALSGLDLNNYDALIRYIKSFVVADDMDGASGEMPFTHKKVNKYGEIEIRKLTQNQKKLTSDEVLQIVKDYRNGGVTQRVD